MTITKPDYQQLQDELHGFTTRKGAVEFLHTNFPHKSKNWLDRHLPDIYALDPAAFERVFMHADSTGEHTVNLVNSHRKQTRKTSVYGHATIARQALIKAHGVQYEGEIVKCACGWERRWKTRNGYAATEGKWHEWEMSKT